MHAADILPLCTIRLTVRLGGEKVRHGTGFFFLLERTSGTEARKFPVIITNNHVLDGWKGLSLTVLTKDASGKMRPRDHQHFEVMQEATRTAVVVRHPDPDVDLCAIPASAFLESLQEDGLRLGNRFVTERSLLSNEAESQLTAIEQIITIGYPDGRWDEVNNRPIVRRGITATPITLDYRGRREFLIDAACFPGTSGSPVFLLEEGTFTLAPDAPLMQQRYALAGILAEMPPPRLEEAKLENVFATTESGAIGRYEIPLHLGIVIKVSRIREVGEAALMAFGF